MPRSGMEGMPSVLSHNNKNYFTHGYLGIYFSIRTSRKKISSEKMIFLSGKCQIFLEKKNLCSFLKLKFHQNLQAKSSETHIFFQILKMFKKKRTGIIFRYLSIHYQFNTPTTQSFASPRGPSKLLNSNNSPIVIRSRKKGSGGFTTGGGGGVSRGGTY